MSETSECCCVCGKELELQVCHSAAGFYLGHFCDQCGPHDRQSGYMATREIAEKALAREIAFRTVDEGEFNRGVGNWS